MTAEISPRGNATVIAAQLLLVAERDGHGVDAVKTTTSGPNGLAFLVPDALYDTWAQEFIPKPTAEEQALPPASRMRRPPKAKVVDVVAVPALSSPEGSEQ